MQLSQLQLFVIKIIVLLPACYWAWFYFANFTTWLAADFVTRLFSAYYADWIRGIELQGKVIDIVTRIAAPQSLSQSLKQADIVFSINPLNYNFGLPLNMALILSSPGNLWVMIRNILISLPVMLVVQVWGIYFAGLKTLFFEISGYLTNPNIHAPSQTELDTIAVCYQLGSLVFPSVIPLIIWIALYRDFIAEIAPTFKRFEA